MGPMRLLLAHAEKGKGGVFLGVASRRFCRTFFLPMDFRTVIKPMDFSAFDTASLRERLGGLRRYL